MAKVYRRDGSLVGEGRSIGAVVTEATDLNRAVLCDVDLSDMDLSGKDFRQANLSHAILDNVNLTGARLSQAILCEAVLTRANLSKANLSEADMYKVDLGDSNLTEANLYGANLYGAFLTRTRLDLADLHSANLVKASLCAADLSAIKSAFKEALTACPQNVPLLQAALREGHINAGGEFQSVLGVLRGPDPSERTEKLMGAWNRGIKLGDTPENNPIVEITLAWIAAWRTEPRTLLDHVLAEDSPW